MSETRESLKWWPKEMEPAERARRAVIAQKLICDLPAESYRRDKDLQNIRLYENSPLVTLYNFAGKYYAEAATLTLPQIEQSTNNRAKSVIDTVAAQIFTTNQRARLKTVDAKWQQRRRARELQNFADGLVLELKLHKLRKRAGLDAAILESGIGAIQFYRREGRCAAERCLATEFTFDPWDGLVNGEFRTLYRRRPMPRDTVLDEFGDGEDGPKTKAIMAAKTVSTGGAPADHIEVFEQWHLPTSKKSGDGWHVIALDVIDGMLEVEEYTKQFHEVVFFSIEGRFTTGLGLSLMSQVRRLQYRINANEFRAERARKLCHSGHLYINKANKIEKSKLSNEIGTVWEGTGDVPPQQIVFQQVAAEWEQSIERDGQRMFENLGVNLAASQGDTNTGLNASAAAKREDTAKSAQRNSERQQRWEDFHLDCVRVALSVVRDCVTKTDNGKDRKRTSGYKVVAPGKRGLTIMDWKEVAMDEDDYILEMQPASPIPQEPAGLVAYGERMLEIGEWTPGELSGYLQDLDADGRTNRKKAQERQLEKVFESLLYDKVSMALPNEFTNYQKAIEVGTEYLAQGEEDEVPEKHLERVRRYLKACKGQAVKTAQAAQAAAQPPAPPATGLAAVA